MAQSQLPRLSRKEYADTVREQYKTETVGLTDDEVIEVALEEDPSTQDLLETPEETFFREGGASAPPAFPSGIKPPSQIPSPIDAQIKGEEDIGGLKLFPKAMQEPVRAAIAPVRAFSQGAMQGMTAGAVKPYVKSTDPVIPQVLGNIVGGGATAALVAPGGAPALGLLGAAQGATMAGRTNLDQLTAERQAAGQAAPTLSDTLTPKGVTRMGAQTVTNALVNMTPLRFGGSAPIAALKSLLVGGAGNMAPTAVDQLIDEGKVDVTQPGYREAYTLAGGVGAGAGAAASLATSAIKPKDPTYTPIPTPEDPKMYYDIPPVKEGDPTGGPHGARYYGPAGYKDELGWQSVGDAATINGQRVRQMRQVDTPEGFKAVEVRGDDGTVSTFTDPFDFTFLDANRVQRSVKIDPRRGPRPAGDGTSPATEPPPSVEMGPPRLGPQTAEATPSAVVPTARFASWVDDGVGGQAPMFLIDGDPIPRGLRTLREQGVPVPDFPAQGAAEAAAAPITPVRPEGETGSADVDLLANVAGTAAGGLIGGLQGEGDDKFNWAMAAIGAGIGLGATTSFRNYFKKIGKEHEIIEGLATHPSINEAYRRTSPGSLRDTDVKAAIKTAYEVTLDDTFTPHALLQREGETWSTKNLGRTDATYFQPAIHALDALTMNKFTIPPTVAENFRQQFADVLKDDNSYERFLRIARLRADIEQRQNDLAKRNTAFSWLQAYKQAKAAGDPVKAREYRTLLRGNPGVLHPLPPTMRGGVPPEHAMASLAALEKEAQLSHPDVLIAADNWKLWGRGLIDQMQKAGVPMGDESISMITNYFPNYHLDKMGESGKISVGGPTGIGQSRSGFMKRRGRQKPEDKLWIDVVGPYFKRELDQRVDLAKLTTARQIIAKYDPYKNGTLPPDQAATPPKGDYTFWRWAIPGESGVTHGEVGGWLPTPIAAEIQKHYAPTNALQKVVDVVNAPLKGFLIRASGGAFIQNNFLGNVADAYFATPMTQWPMLSHAGLKAIASTILETAQGPLKRKGIEYGPQLQGIVDVSEQGRKAGIGTEAAAAEITSQALSDPRIADKAIDPLTPSKTRAADTVQRPFRAYGRFFDEIRGSAENVTRLAHFIHLVQNNGTDPAQAGRIVNMVQGDYNPTSMTVREKDLKRFAIFWTFYKNALPNWLPLLGREIAYGDQVVGGRGAARLKTLAPMAKKLGAVSAIGLAANLWNHLFFPDAEASLTDYQKEQFHLLMPDVMGKKGMWDEERQQWNLAYHGFPTPMNVAHRAVGLGGIQNRVMHDIRGTASAGDELERSWEQIKTFWGGLAHPFVGTVAGLMSGKDPVTGQPVVEPGSTNWQAAMQTAAYPLRGLPGMRQTYQAARDAAEPGETAGNFVRRMLVSSLYQPLNRENQEVRALARAVAGGNRAATKSNQSAREAALFRGEQQQWTPEEVNSILTGADKVSWQGKVVSLSELPKFLAKAGEIKPSDPGAVDELTKAGKTTTTDLRKSGPVFIPTRDFIRAMGPDETLKQFLASFQGDQRQGDAWRAGALSISQQLRNESKNWEVPASIMMMLQQSPSGEANTEILRRVHGLENAFDSAKQLGDILGRKW